MIRWSGIAMVVVGILHMIVLGIDAVGEIPGWVRFELWTAEHWRPLRAQAPELLVSNAAFWSTIGSFAVPLIMLDAWRCGDLAGQKADFPPRIPGLVAAGLDGHRVPNNRGERLSARYSHSDLSYSRC
jgi:hypothetical protein